MEAEMDAVWTISAYVADSKLQEVVWQLKNIINR